MDGIDRAILEELKRHGRVSASEISKNVNLSVPAVAERIRKMEGAGVIRGYTALLDRRKTGAGLLAFVFVNLDRTEHVDAFSSHSIAINLPIKVVGQWLHISPIKSNKPNN